VDLVLFVVEAGKYTLDDAKVLALLPPDLPCLLVANKLDRAGDRRQVVSWMRDMRERREFLEYFPMSAKSKADVQRLLEVCAKHLPEQAWMYAEDDLTDRSERFQVGEVVREKLFRLTGDELPYTCAVVVDDFKEEPGKTVSRFVKLAVTIIVERDGHKAMVIGEGGERLKRIGTEARTDLEKLLDAKVFLQLWVKVKSGWADDEARVRAFGYE
jgi:GTPase